MINYHKNYFQNNTKLYVFLGLAALGAIHSLYTYVPGCLLMDEFYKDMNHITQPLGQPTEIRPVLRCSGPTVLEYTFENISIEQYRAVVDDLRQSNQWTEASVGNQLTDDQLFCKGKTSLRIFPGDEYTGWLAFYLVWEPDGYCYKNY